MCCIFAFAGNNNESADVSSIEKVNSQENVAVASDEEMIPESESAFGYGIYIDGYFLAAVSDKAAAETVFENELSDRVSSLNLSASAEHSFVNAVKFVEGDYDRNSFVEASGIASLISDSVIDCNGEPLPVKLSVSSVVTSVEKVVIEYETKTVYTDSLLDGTVKTLSDGYNGEGEEIKKVTYINGVESETVSDIKVTTAAIDEVLEVGTRAGSYTIASSIDFEWPYDGFIYSYYGESEDRVQTHKGIDLVNYGGCYRDPAYAAADGVVIFSGDKGNGYGNYVIIDHGNGILTYYAHFDSCSVSTGDVVKAGDEVGKIGSTGRSTGNHLHFEIQINGVSVNPLDYLD